MGGHSRTVVRREGQRELLQQRQAQAEARSISGKGAGQVSKVFLCRAHGTGSPGKEKGWGGVVGAVWTFNCAKDCNDRKAEAGNVCGKGQGAEADKLQCWEGHTKLGPSCPSQDSLKLPQAQNLTGLVTMDRTNIR